MATTASCRYYLGVDCGTSSVRAVVISADRRPVCCANAALEVFRPGEQIYQQSTEQIWAAVCQAVQAVTAGIDASQIDGIGFDATCSLVVLDEQGKELDVTPDDCLQSNSACSSRGNVIMWCDHRANRQADFINSTKHACLSQVGGKVSLEMQPPKLLWLKQHLPATFRRAAHFMDLTDFLTFRSTGSCRRSICCLVCKWLYSASSNCLRWDETFWQQIGLAELIENNFCRIGGDKPVAAGVRVGVLSLQSARELGLAAGARIPVAAGLIDAHAGALCTIACRVTGSLSSPFDADRLQSHLCMIAGTSACFLAIRKEMVAIPGIWGPYYSALLPDTFLSEAGQSAVASVLQLVANQAEKFIPEACGQEFWLLEKIREIESEKGWEFVTKMAADVHVWPDYHGNRSPFAEPNMTAMISGLTLQDFDHADIYFARQYIAHVQALAYSARLIIDQMQLGGYRFSSLVISGGLQSNAVYLQTHADVLGLPILVAQECEQTVAYGAAMLGACASGNFNSINAVLDALAPLALDTALPKREVQPYHDKKYAIFLELGKLQQKIIQHCDDKN